VELADEYGRLGKKVESRVGLAEKLTRNVTKNTRVGHEFVYCFTELLKDCGDIDLELSSLRRANNRLLLGVTYKVCNIVLDTILRKATLCVLSRCRLR